MGWKYLLDDAGNAVEEPDLHKWADGMEAMNRQIALDTVGPYKVSTVFLGLDRRLGGSAPPLLFETMVFGSPELYICKLCATRDEAVAGHAATVAAVRATLN